MRDKLNSNPLLQAGLIGVLLLFAGIFLLSAHKGGEEESEASAASGTVASTSGATSAPTPGGASGVLAAARAAGDAPPLPAPVTSAWEEHRTVVLLFVHNAGIDDSLVAAATRRLQSMRDVSAFIVPAHSISRYAAIAEGLGVERVPALVVLHPKPRDAGGIPTASVSYGFQSPQSVAQAVVDAGYRGRTLAYHP
jgi:hypothetical protein